MKKLIAFSLAAASFALISGNAMAFAPTQTVQVDAGPVVGAASYLVRNVDGPLGSCVYGMDSAGPLPSPTLTCYLQEQKVLGNTNCALNQFANINSSLTLSIAQGFNTCQLFDQFGFPSNAIALVAGETIAGATGSVVLSTVPFIALPIRL